MTSSVFLEWVFLLSPWLFVGPAMGAVASVAVAGVSVVGDRVFPERRVSRGPRVDGTDRRRHEIRDYLAAIDEQFVEDCPAHGETAAFFLPDRGVTIISDAQTLFRLERAGTYTVPCEHEMPGGQFGRRLPFSAPDVEPGLVDLDDPVLATFDRLDFLVTAFSEAVQDVCRVRMKGVHPDHGGDQGRSRELRKAYTMAREHAEG